MWRGRRERGEISTVLSGGGGGERDGCGGRERRGSVCLHMCIYIYIHTYVECVCLCREIAEGKLKRSRAERLVTIASALYTVHTTRQTD